MIEYRILDTRKYDIVNVTDGEEHFIIKEQKLMFSPATNKWHKIVEFVEDCSKVIGPKFDEWFNKYLTDYNESGYSVTVIRDNIPEIMRIVDEYIEKKEINFEDYINRSKISKNSIFFDANEIREIIRASDYLKLYYIISQDIDRKLPIQFHREIYQTLTKNIRDKNILLKLFKIVSSKTYKYNITDSYMWEYIRMIYCKTTDMQILSIFNFLVNNILVSCDSTVNPIGYIISVIDVSIKWILQSVYKDVIIYSDTINTEDIYSSQSKDNLKTYAYNDTIGKLIVTSHNCLPHHDIDDARFRDKTDEFKEASLFSKFITYPILTKVLEIPYKHFLTIPVEHGYLLNILVYHHLPEEFKTKYPNISNMLLLFNKEKPIEKTTYKIKQIDQFTNSFRTFWGFKNLSFVYECYSTIVGTLSRNSYGDFKGNNSSNIPLVKLERELVEFYNRYFNDEYKEMFEEMKNEFDALI